MIASIRGKLMYATSLFVVIEVGGLGYQIFIPTNLYSKLPAEGTELQLYTSHIVRESSQTLYGFGTRQEREFFELLQNVTGFGPKSALSVVGHLPLPDFYNAIHRQDIRLLTQVPGIGKKGAERLIVEIRDKLKPTLLSGAASDGGAGVLNDALSALVQLGYSQEKARFALQKTVQSIPQADLSKLITGALRELA